MDNSGTINLDESNFDREINSDKPILVDFWADWCGPCKLIAPILEELATEYGGKLRIGKLDVDDNPAVTGRFSVMSIPTLILFKDGDVATRLVGAKGKNQLRQEIEAFL